MLPVRCEALVAMRDGEASASPRQSKCSERERECSEWSPRPGRARYSVPVRKVAWIVLFGVPVATVVAAAIAVQTYLSMLDHGHSFGRIFVWQWISWIFWALAAPLVLRAGRAWMRLAILGVV